MTKANANIIKSLIERENFSNSLKPIDLLERNRFRSLYQRDIKGHTGCVNALEFSPDEKFLLSGGDDLGVNLWVSCDVVSRKEPKPLRIMKSRHDSNIFSLGFSLDGQSAYSAGNDCQFLQHDIQTGEQLYRYEADQTIHRLDVNPASNGVCVFTTDDGTVTIADTSNNQHTTYQMGHPVFSAMYNPIQPEFLCVAAYKGLFIYDVRNMKEPYSKLKNPKKNRCTFARWTPEGTGIIGLINIDSVSYFYDFDEEPISLGDIEFLNSCTMKSCTFAGNDTVLCGSDQWDVFAWKLPLDTEVKKINDAHTILRGHRSIVNHIRYSELNNVIVSSGVEKILKVWCPFELNESYRDPIRREMGTPSPYAMFSPGNANVGDERDEDLNTLHQFDMYLRQAQHRKLKIMTNPDESDSDDSDSPNVFLGDFLNVALINWDELPDSDDSEEHSEDTSSEEECSEEEDL